MANKLLNLSVITRGLLRLTHRELGHGMLYDSRFEASELSYEGRAADLKLMGISLYQFNVDWEVDTSKFLLRFEDFCESILASRATMLAKKIHEMHGLVSFDLPLPQRAMIESCRYRCDGMAIRGVISPIAGNEVARWDIQFGACGYDTLIRMGLAA